MAPPHHPFEPGPTKVWSNVSVCQEENDSIVSHRSKRDLDVANTLLLLQRESSMPECLHRSNEETSSAKSKNSNKRTQTTMSSATLPRVSTSRDTACVPFWTACTGAWSRRLWSCTETDLHALPVTYWSTFSAKKDVGSWYTVAAQAPKTPIHSLRTSWPSQQCLWRLITENEQRKDENDAEKEQAKKKRKQDSSKTKKVYNKPRVIKYRVFPLKEQREQLKQWFGLTRRAYNTAVEVHNSVYENDPDVVAAVAALANEVKQDKSGRPLTKKDKHGVPYNVTRGHNDALKMYIRHKEKAAAFVKECPQAIRDSGILDFEKAVRSGTAKRQEQRERGEDTSNEKFKYRTKKDKNQTFEINARDWKDTGKIGSLFRSMHFPKKDPRPDKAAHAIRVQMDRLGRVFLCFVSEREVKSENQAPDPANAFHNTASLDPGVRTFQTIYDADGQSIEWGKADMTQIMVLCRHADSIQSKISRKRATWALRHAYYRQLQTIKDKVKECHRKLALFLCENYRVILIPKFAVSRMVKKRNRKIKSKTVRQMACWSHYAFREALKAKAELFPWVRVVEVNEAYTSMTCEECGVLNHQLSGSKNFRCQECGHCADRDIHAAKNILLRYLTREQISLPEVSP